MTFKRHRPRFWQIRSDKKGPHGAIVGHIHGDERSGEAIQWLSDGNIRLSSGSLLLIEANPAARERNVRYISHDLNRLFDGDHGDHEHFPEGMVAQELKRLLSSVDFVIDLHATSQPSMPFVASYVDDAATRNLARALKLPLVVGFQKYLRGTLIEWCTFQGKPTIAVECGLLCDDATRELAISVCIDWLTHYGLLAAGSPSTATLAVRPGYRRYSLMAAEYVDDAKSFNYAVEIVPFRTLLPETLVGRDAKRSYFSPNQDSTIVMPTAPGKIDSLGPAFYFCVPSED